MLPFKDIRSAILRGLKALTSLPVIEMNGGGDIPETAFLTYDFSEGFGPSRGFPEVSQEGSIQRRTETVIFTVSFLSYADDKATSISNAILARDWFKGDGRLLLKEKNIVVVEIGAISNRDINIGTEWERRQGFDIEFRTQDITESEIETIDKVKFEGVDWIGST